MIKTIMIFLFAITVVIFACHKDVQKVEKEDLSAIHALLTNAAEKAYTGDIEGFLSYRAPDAISIADHLHNPVTLNKALKMYKSVSVKAIAPMVVDEIMVSGSLGFARFTYATEFLAQDGNPNQRSYSRHFYILRKQKCGSWKIVRDIWSNIPYDSVEN
jgi:ketosteroid isomerase-like protein